MGKVPSICMYHTDGISIHDKQIEKHKNKLRRCHIFCKCACVQSYTFFCGGLSSFFNCCDCNCYSFEGEVWGQGPFPYVLIACVRFHGFATEGISFSFAGIYFRGAPTSTDTTGEYSSEPRTPGALSFFDRASTSMLTIFERLH